MVYRAQRTLRQPTPLSENEQERRNGSLLLIPADETDRAALPLARNPQERTRDKGRGQNIPGYAGREVFIMLAAGGRAGHCGLQ